MRILVILFVAVFTFVLSIGIVFLFIIQNKIKGSEPYKTSIEFVESNTQVKQAVGKVEGYSFIVGAKINQSNFNSNALFEYTVYGSKTNMPIRIKLVKDSNSVWKVESFLVR